MEPRIDYLKSARGAYHAMLGIEHYLQQCGLEESLLHLIKDEIGSPEPVLLPVRLVVRESSAERPA